MNDIKRNTFWFWGFIILLVLNISAISTMLTISYRMHNRLENTTFHTTNFRDRMIKNKRTSYHNANAWKDMGFTKEQRAFMIEQRKIHIHEISILKDKLKDIQSKLFDELANEKVNTVKINKLKLDISNIHQAILKENINFYEKLKSKLSNKQMQLVRKHIDRQFRHKNTVRTTKKQ